MKPPTTLVTVTCIHCRDEFTAETFRLARAMHDLHTCRRTPFLGPPSARSGNRGVGKDAAPAEPQPDTAAQAPALESLPPLDAAGAEEQP